MRYENNITEHGILTILMIGVLAGIVMLNNANACGVNWQQANPIPQGINSVTSVTYGGGRFVATAGYPGGFLTSLDGMTWTPSTPLFGTQIYNDVTWGGNQFVAVGKEGTGYPGIQTSPDGVNWTPHNLEVSQELHGVIWNGNLYVAVGDSGTLTSQSLSYISISSTGVNWNTPYLNTTGPLSGVAWNGSQFVTVGTESGSRLHAPILTSSNGVNWTLHDSGTTQYFYDVTWGGNQFVAVGSGGSVSGTGIKAIILTSPDGLNWTPRESGTTNDLNSVAWNGSQFVAVGSNGTILTSTDGRTWIGRNSGTTNALHGVTWGGNQFVAVGEPSIILTSRCDQPVNYLLTVSKTGSGSGTVTSNPAGISCGADCSENYASGTAITLTASPASGSTFASWSGACSGTGSCAVTMNAAKNVAATFNVIGQTLAQHTAGLFDPATSAFYLKNSHAGGAADEAFRFGPAGRDWIPIAGDWDGDGTATVGLFDPTTSAFYLKNSHAGGAADLSFRFGPAGRGWKPRAGDWDGDGTDTVGLFDPAKSAFYLKNSHAGGAADLSFRFGPAGRGWIPVTGHWGGGSNGNTRWSALNTVCCSGGSLTYEVTIDGVAKRSTLGSCDADPTFEGFASTTAGAKDVTIKVLSPACGNAQSQVTASLAGNTCYRFTLHLQGSDLVNVLQTVACPSSSADAAAVTRAETTPVVTLPMDAVGPPAPGQIPGSLIEIRP